MSSEPSPRRRSRGDTTRIAIIEAAELLVAEHGVNGASLRQIGTASGSANTNVVAYHFGNKSGLISAVIEHRLSVIDGLRAEAMREHERDARPLSLIELLFIMFDPIIQQRNSEGRRSYAAFLRGVFRSTSAWQLGFLGDEYPTTQKIIKAIQAHLQLDRELFRARMKICTNMIISSLDLLEMEGVVTDASETTQFLDALAMAEAALQARPRAVARILPLR